jgi:hypothetical protein
MTTFMNETAKQARASESGAPTNCRVKKIVQEGNS